MWTEINDWKTLRLRLLWKIWLQVHSQHIHIPKCLWKLSVFSEILHWVYVHIQHVCLYLMDCSRNISHCSEDSLYTFSSPPLIPLTCWTKAQSLTRAGSVLSPGCFGGCLGMLSFHRRPLLYRLLVLRGREGCNTVQKRNVRGVWKTNQLNFFKGFLSAYYRSIE